MLTHQDILAQLSATSTGSLLVIYDQPVGDVVLRGHVFDRAVVFDHVAFQGDVDLSQAVFRGHASFVDCHFAKSCRFPGVRFEAGAMFDGSSFATGADFFRAVFVGSARLWNTRFGGPAIFRECQVEPPIVRSPQADGVADFSWSRFEAKATFTYTRFAGDVYFWRSIFGGDVMLDECAFAGGATFAGNPTAVMFPRFGLLDPAVVAELERRELLLADTEAFVEHDGERVSRHLVFAGIYSREHLRERLAKLDLPLAPSDVQTIERCWTEGARRMFAPNAVVSFRHTTFQRMDDVTFQKVDFTDVNLDAAIAGTPETQAAFRARMKQDSCDMFVSHASEDKMLVRPLVEALRRMGQTVWFDQQGIRVGDSLHETIDQGLASARVGVVVLSKSFFGKQWTQHELEALVKRHGRSDQRILPVWYGVTEDEVASHSKQLADLFALKVGERPIDELALDLVKEAVRG